METPAMVDFDSKEKTSMGDEKVMPETTVSIDTLVKFVNFVCRVFKACEQIQKSGEVIVVIPEGLSKEEVISAQRILGSAGFSTKTNGKKCLNLWRSRR